MTRLELWLSARSQANGLRSRAPEYYEPQSPRWRQIRMMERRCSVLFPEVPRYEWRRDEGLLLDVVRLARVDGHGLANRLLEVK